MRIVIRTLVYCKLCIMYCWTDEKTSELRIIFNLKNSRKIKADVVCQLLLLSLIALPREFLGTPDQR